MRHKNIGKSCSVEGCDNKAICKSFCNNCYHRWLRNGTTDLKVKRHPEMHGKRYTKLYNTWKTMISRCHNPNTEAYRYYGARGIQVCDKWRNSFTAFKEDMGDRPEDMTLDRIDTNGNYEPKNCRWATLETQHYNKRTTVRYQGKTIKEWAEALGQPHMRFRSLYKAQGIEYAISYYQNQAARDGKEMADKEAYDQLPEEHGARKK